MSNLEKQLMLILVKLDKLGIIKFKQFKQLKIKEKYYLWRYYVSKR